MKKYRWTALLLALVLAAGVCAGCGKKQTDAPAQDNQIQTNPDEGHGRDLHERTITLRFSLQDGRGAGATNKTFPLDGELYHGPCSARRAGAPPISHHRGGSGELRSRRRDEVHRDHHGGENRDILPRRPLRRRQQLPQPRRPMSPPSTARRTTSPRGSTAASMTWRSCQPPRPDGGRAAFRHDCGKRRRAHLHGGRRCLDGGRRGRVSGDGVPRGRTLAAGVLRLPSTTTPAAAPPPSAALTRRMSR